MSVALASLLTALAVDPAETVVVAWQVPDGCPGVDALHTGIRRSLRGLTVDSSGTVRVGVAVTREAAGAFRLELRLDAGDGPSERVLTTDSCAAAIDTAAWLIAIAIDVRAAPPPTSEPATTPPGEPPPEGDPSTVPAPPAEPASDDPLADPTPPDAPPDRTTPDADPLAPPPERAKPPPSRTDQLHLDLWAGGGLGLGVLPRLAPAAAVGFTLAGPRWQAELSGHYWAQQRVDLGSGHGGRFVHGHVAARGCGAWERGRVRLPVCGGLALGGVTGEGTGQLTPQIARSLWVGLLAGAGVRVRLHPRVGLLAHAEAVIGLRRPGFLLEPAPRLVFRPGVGGLSAFFALAIRLR